MSAAEGHACAVRQTGQVVCWGSNYYGQLGNGTKTNSALPMQVAGLNDAIRVSAGTAYTCAIRKSGSVVCWGSPYISGNPFDTSKDNTTPVPVGALTDAIALDVGQHHACVVRQNGAVACWGGGGSGELGNGSTKSSYYTPVEVSGISDAVAVAAGHTHTCALHKTGTISCWGAGDEGQLGNVSMSQSYAPVLVSGVTDATALDSGAYGSCALRSSGVIRCWGRGWGGELGNGAQHTSATPVDVTGLSDAVGLGLGPSHACAVRKAGSIGCWGWGPIGNNVPPVASTPVTVKGLADAIAVGAGDESTCAVLKNGTLTCWGWGAGDVISTSGTMLSNASTPLAVQGISDVTAVTGGEFFFCALRQSGVVACWGQNAAGELGIASPYVSVTPVQVPGVSDAIGLSSGHHFTCAARQIGGIVCWGSGPFKGGPPPALVSPMVTASLACGWKMPCCALGNGGTVTCWVSDAGNWIPNAVSGVSAVSVAAGLSHACAVLQSGSVLCWGENYLGQLGNGSTVDSDTPVLVSGVSDAVKVSARLWHTCALRKTGAVACWGRNDYGQLGDGSGGTGSSISSVPVDVAGLSDAIAVTTGLYHSCALRQSGAVSCWGSGGNGQLGDGRPWWTTPQNVIWPPP